MYYKEENIPSLSQEAQAIIKFENDVKLLSINQESGEVDIMPVYVNLNLTGFRYVPGNPEEQINSKNSADFSVATLNGELSGVANEILVNGKYLESLEQLEELESRYRLVTDRVLCDDKDDLCALFLEDENGEISIALNIVSAKYNRYKRRTGPIITRSTVNIEFDHAAHLRGKKPEPVVVRYSA